MIKKILLILACVYITSWFCKAQKKEIGYSAYINMGGYIPVNYKNSVEELNFIELASINGSNPGFEIGGTVYYKRIGFNLGFGYYKYEIDVLSFIKEKQTIFAESNITAFISPKIRDIPIFTGISYYLKLNNLYFEPAFFIRLNKVIAPNYADIYFWENDSLIRSINYLSNSGYRLDYVPSLSLSYFYPLRDGYRIGIQVSYQYSFSNPKYKYDKTDIDLKAETFANERIAFTNKYSCSKINFGVILRFN